MRNNTVLQQPKIGLPVSFIHQCYLKYLFYTCEHFTRGFQDPNKRHNLQKLFCGKDGDPPSLFNYVIYPKRVKYYLLVLIVLTLRLLSSRSLFVTIISIHKEVNDLNQIIFTTNLWKDLEFLCENNLPMGLWSGHMTVSVCLKPC